MASVCQVRRGQNKATSLKTTDRGRNHRVVSDGDNWLGHPQTRPQILTLFVVAAGHLFQQLRKEASIPIIKIASQRSDMVKSKKVKAIENSISTKISSQVISNLRTECAAGWTVYIATSLLLFHNQ